MDEYVDKLTKYYEALKKANAKSKSGKSKSKIIIPDIQRKDYRYYKDYLKDLDDKINQNKKRILELKYDLLYGFGESIEEFDQLTANITELTNERDVILLKYKHKEDRKKRDIKKLMDDIEALLINYREMTEEKKQIYLDIQE